MNNNEYGEKPKPKLTNCHPKISRGKVWCIYCDKMLKINTEKAMKDGWPKCCGYTMSIDAPEER